MSNKGKIIFKALGNILRSLWHLFVVATYGAAKLIQALAGMLVKITEKLIK